MLGTVFKIIKEEENWESYSLFDDLSLTFMLLDNDIRIYPELIVMYANFNFEMNYLYQGKYFESILMNLKKPLHLTLNKNIKKNLELKQSCGYNNIECIFPPFKETFFQEWEKDFTCLPSFVMVCPTYFMSYQINHFCFSTKYYNIL